MEDNLYTLILQGRSYCIDEAGARAIKESPINGETPLAIDVYCVVDGCRHTVQVVPKDVISIIGHIVTPDIATRLRAPIPENVVPLFA